MKVKAFFVIMIVFLFTFQIPSATAKKFDDDGFQFFKWDNPTPRFSDFGLNVDDVKNIIGEGQLLIYHKGREIDLWTADNSCGAIKKYKDARFVSSMAVLNQPRKEVIDFYMNFKNYPKHMKQYTVGRTIRKKGRDRLVRLKQVYKVTIVTLSADFRYLYSEEDNGDFSVLLLDGDVGAGVSRLEFISLSESQTLVVSTNWVHTETARFVYRTIVKAQPDMKITAAVGASAMLTEQFKTAIDNRNQCPPKDIKRVPLKPNTPIYAKGTISVGTMRQLTDLGTLSFVHPLQWINTDKGVKKVEFITTAAQIPGTIHQSKPISSDFTRINEYFEQAKEVKMTPIANGTEIDWYFKFGFGFVGINMNYTTKSDWLNENTVLFRGIKGDIDPLNGAWEWIDLGNQSTLLVFTVANQISEDASWVLRLANHVPNFDIISCLFMGVLIVEKQSDWLLPQIDSAPVLSVN